MPTVGLINIWAAVNVNLGMHGKGRQKLTLSAIFVREQEVHCSKTMLKHASKIKQ